MSRNVQIYSCGHDMYKVVVRPSKTNITQWPSALDERAKENRRTALARSRRIITDVLHCNNFAFFLTITFGGNESPTRDSVVKACTNGLRSIKRHCDKPVGYIVVPELSFKDDIAPGRWHGHIMLTDIPANMLTPYHMSDKGLPAITYRRMAAGIGCFSVPVYERYGYCLAERVRGTKADFDTLANYLTKTMYLDTCAKLPKGQRRMITSHGLSRPEHIFNGIISDGEYQAICKASGDVLLDCNHIIHYIPRAALMAL